MSKTVAGWQTADRGIFEQLCTLTPISAVSKQHQLCLILARADSGGVLGCVAIIPCSPGLQRALLQHFKRLSQLVIDCPWYV